MCAPVDDLPDLRIRERLEDELHLRHLAIGVLTEALDVGDGQLPARAGAAAVVLPALECKRVVDGLRRTSERAQRDVARCLVRRQQVRPEERVGERGGGRRVGLAESTAASDGGRALGDPTGGAGRGARLAVRSAGQTAPGRDECERDRREQQRQHLVLRSHFNSLHPVRGLLFSAARAHLDRVMSGRSPLVEAASQASCFDRGVQRRDRRRRPSRR